MPRTAQQLVRELADLRLADFILITSSSPGTDKTVVSSALSQYLPADADQVNWWVYCSSGTAGNVGQERRAKTWSYQTSTLTLHPPGFPSATNPGDEFEIHRLVKRSAKLDALNSGVRQLGLHWYRDVVDESITTVSSTWRYELPSSVSWVRVYKVEIQATTNSSMSGYPYLDAKPWNPQLYRDVSPTGAETWYLQFGLLPPSGRKIRIYGEAAYPALSGDQDVLALSGAWEGKALEWLFDWAVYRLWEREGHRQPSSEGDRYMFWTRDKLMRQREALLLDAPSHKEGRVLVPGMDTGLAAGVSNPSYLGALKSGAFS